MEEILRLVREGLDWSTRSVGNLAKSLAVCLAVLFLGGCLVFVVPQWATKSAISSAEAAISTQQTTLDKVSLEYNAQSVWTKPVYLEGLYDKLQLAADGSHLGQARQLLDQAKSTLDADAKIKLANEAKSLAEGDQPESVKNIVAEVSRKLTSNLDLRAQARTAITDYNENFSAALESYANAQKRFDAEAGEHLTKYVKPLSDSLSQAQNFLSGAQSALDQVAINMPPDSSTEQKGDPLSALEWLNVAKQNIDSVNTLVTQVTSGLDYLTEARKNAKSHTDQALGDIQASWTHLEDVVRQYGFSLAKSLAAAHNSYLQATVWQQEAQKALDTSIAAEGGKIDYPASYEAANKAISLAQACVTEADRQVGLYQATQQKLWSFDTKLTSAEAQLATAQGSLGTLQTYHARDLWVSLEANLTSSQTLVDSAITLKSAAVDHLNNEEFDTASSEIDQALTHLSTIETLAASVINLATTLETYRSSWPSAESTAAATISLQTLDINSYGQYDIGAVNDYSTAVSYLSQARSDATTKHYQSAVDNANRAAQLANGTGARAYNSYAAAKAQETQVAAAATQAQASADAAATYAAQAAEDDDSGGGGYDYGDGGSDDGGGYDYGDGGGSDDGGWSDSGGGDDGGGWSDDGGSDYGDDGGGW